VLEVQIGSLSSLRFVASEAIVRRCPRERVRVNFCRGFKKKTEIRSFASQASAQVRHNWRVLAVSDG
jgi:hypothetical protein